MFRMIAAVGAGGVIGKDGKIPWDLPEDRRMFRELTMGGTLIMGRKDLREHRRASAGT